MNFLCFLFVFLELFLFLVAACLLLNLLLFYYFFMGLVKILLGSVVIRWLFLFSLLEDYYFLLMEQMLRI